MRRTLCSEVSRRTYVCISENTREASEARDGDIDDKIGRGSRALADSSEGAVRSGTGTSPARVEQEKEMQGRRHSRGSTNRIERIVLVGGSVFFGCETVYR